MDKLKVEYMPGKPIIPKGFVEVSFENATKDDFYSDPNGKWEDLTKSPREWYDMNGTEAWKTFTFIRKVFTLPTNLGSFYIFAVHSGKYVHFHLSPGGWFMLNTLGEKCTFDSVEAATNCISVWKKENKLVLTNT